MAKQIFPTTYYVFTPGVGGSGTINFASFPGFVPANLTAVNNITTNNTLIYGSTLPSYGGSWTGNVLTLKMSTVGMSTSDVLEFFYDVPLKTNFLTSQYTSASTLNTDIITGTVNGWFDVSLYQSIAIEFETTTPITGGVITFEATNDISSPNATVTSLNLQDSTTTTATLVSSLTLAASTNKWYEGQLNFKYIRFRISTSVVGSGSVKASVTLLQTPYVSILAKQVNVLNTPAVTISGTPTVINESISPTAIADVASAVITTSTTTAAFTPTFGSTYVVQIPVTAVSGTNPILWVHVQESYDGGTNWTTVYSFEPITTGGANIIYVSPVLYLKGNRVRYLQNISGSTPSFTRAINRLQTNINPQQFLRQIINTDSTSTNTGFTFNVNATPPQYSTVLVAPDSMAISMTVAMSNLGSGAAPVIQLQGSMDNVTWYNVGTAITTTIAPQQVYLANSVGAKFYRASLTTNGTAAVLNYLFLQAN